MKRTTTKGMALSALATWWLVCFPGCEDPGLHEALPLIDSYAVGDSDNHPSPDTLLPIPGTSEVVIDFGRVDVGTIHQRYLFVPNAGLGVLNLTRVTPGENPNADFRLACLAAAGFVENCPDPVAISPGASLIIEVTYLPATAGPDTDDYTLDLNTREHGQLKLVLMGEGIEPEIQVCVSDCLGDQQSTACQQADELCNDMVDKDDMLLAFGDADMETSLARTVTIRNQGARTLELTSVELALGSPVFSLDRRDLTFPFPLESGAEIQVEAGYHPDAGGEHVGRLDVASSDSSEPSVSVHLHGRGIAPRACVDPRQLDFGNVVTGQSESRSFSITSCGLVELELVDLALSADTSGDFSLVSPPVLPQTLEVGESVTVEVRYSPLEPGEDQGGVDYFSSDQTSDPATQLTGTVPLTGRSTPLVCDVRITPTVADFGVAEIGQTAEMDLAVFNAGNNTCTIQGVELTTNSAEEEFAILESPGAGATLEPEESLLIGLGYSPADRGQDVGLLTIRSDDEDSEEIPVVLNGFGIFPGGEGPVAICSVDPVMASSFDSLTWYGDQSFDTNGHPITDYQWSIESFPPGSAATLQGAGPIRTTEADLAGDYSARLTVVNDLGQVSEPCIATATVVPTEDLWIEMYWTHAGDDFDLHLLAPGGSPRTDGDCYYMNCDEGAVLEWGDPGYLGDNPGLDLDDIAGTGPENINIADPADGIYTVMVHDFAISAYQGANPVTVKVYIDGVLAETFQESISGENYEWYVCEIDWTNKTVTPL